MKKIVRLLLILLLVFSGRLYSQCSTTDATGCFCDDPNQSDCDLLPDIGISDWAILNFLGGPTEYSQIGNGINNGRLRVTGSTPNYGVGPFTVGAEQIWTCGLDTFYDFNQALAVCNTPKQLIKQKVYHKTGNQMSYWERWAGSMTYHPSHGHMHVDDWAIFTLRVEDPNDPNPLNWAIVGNGSKVGFCLMDFGTCSNFSGHCRDANGNILQNGDFVNYGLGGGQYSCSPVEQGISVGHTDIYSENLDGMWIDIPPGTCNGDYWIVIEVDPNNNFLESDETNNWAAVPFTLTEQEPNGSNYAVINTDKAPDLCAGDSITLSANAGSSFQWSTGATTQSITVTSAGSYTVTVSGPCGTGVSDPMVVTMTSTSQAPTTVGATGCGNSSLNLSVNGPGSYYWFDAPVGGNFVGSGSSFTTPTLSTTTDYYVEREEIIPGTVHTGGPLDNGIGTGAYWNGTSSFLEFDAHEDFTLVSVWVNANGDGVREIRVTDPNLFLIASTSVFIPDGHSRVTLNLPIPAGINYRLGISPGSMVELFANNAGATYPYQVGDVASITNSSSGVGFYFWFYDWEVKTPDLFCVTPRAAATASILPLPNVNFTGLNASYSAADPPVVLQGSPAGGVFSGPGISGNTFDPNQAGGGGPYTVTYTFTDANGCSNSHNQQVTVNAVVSVLDGVVPGELEVYPNPHQDQFVLGFELLKAREVDLVLYDLAGKPVREEHHEKWVGKYRETWDTRDLAPGVYLLQVQVDGRAFTTRLLRQ